MLSINKKGLFCGPIFNLIPVLREFLALLSGSLGIMRLKVAPLLFIIQHASAARQKPMPEWWNR